MNRCKEFFLVLLIVLSVIACGNKKMPKPVLKEEMFYWQKVKFKYHNGCLTVEAELGGRYKNLKEVFLEVDDSGCLECPFRGRIIPTEFKREGCHISLKSCGLKKVPFRFKLLGTNIYRGLDRTTDCYFVVRP